MLSSDEDEEQLVSSEEEEPVSGQDEEEGEEGESEYEVEDEMPVCRLSQPAHPHTLSLAKIKPPVICFVGSGSESLRSEEELYYYCTTCDVEFHEDCYDVPRKMTHPYHPQHPLLFSVLNHEVVYDCNYHDWGAKEFVVVGVRDHGSIYDSCTWCGRDFSGETYYFYRCSICNFCLCPNCSNEFPLPTIQIPKNHHHPLIFLPRPLLLPCDACGVVKRSEPSYACFECNFVVHMSCIDLPRVIKLTRHPHRLSYTPCLSLTVSPCRVCYKTVDVKYGHYSCNHDDWSYVVHSKCATHENIWDGRELEWEPEEREDPEDIAPFTKVGDDLIKYFCHDHHLKLDKYDGVRDKDKQCEACILRIDSHDFYNCVECDFFLHEICANLPRKLDHALHNHPLFLDPTPPRDYTDRSCCVCYRAFSGFRYKCSFTDCDGVHHRNPKTFQVDVECILFPDCFTHKSHEHPLFISIPATYDNGLCCEVCKVSCMGSFYLQCTICEYAICHRCATIPDKLDNKYDALPLSLCYGEVSNATYWCEVCEGVLDPREWFYTCNRTSITFHQKCVFGNFGLMKPGHMLSNETFYGRLFVEVICNNSHTRPTCEKCRTRCSSYVYFRVCGETDYCSFACLSWNK